MYVYRKNPFTYLFDIDNILEIPNMSFNLKNHKNLFVERITLL